MDRYAYLRVDDELRALEALTDLGEVPPHTEPEEKRA